MTKKQNRNTKSNNYIIGGLILIGGIYAFSRLKKNNNDEVLTDLDGKDGTFTSQWIESGVTPTPGFITLQIKSSATKFSNIYTLSPNGPNNTWGTLIVNGVELTIAEGDITAAEIIVGPEKSRSLTIQFKDNIGPPGVALNLPTLTYTLTYTGGGISSGFTTSGSSLNFGGQKYLINGTGKLDWHLLDG